MYPANRKYLGPAFTNWTSHAVQAVYSNWHQRCLVFSTVIGAYYFTVVQVQ